MEHPNIPNQTKGGHHDVVNMHCANTLEQAMTDYAELHRRLMAVNHWHEFSDKIKAEFSLIDATTLETTEEFTLGNYIKIDIPGPGSPSGHGFDWTKIIAIEKHQENDEQPFMAFTIQPCPAPDSDTDTIAHFYNDATTNTFIIRRIGNCLFAEVHGRNETDNVENLPFLDLVRNKAVAIGGKFGLGNLNWFGFTLALLEPFKP